MGEGSEYDAQHVRLLEGLAAAIREKGLSKTQLSDIVRHAKASRRTFYKHFPDKDACFVELAHRLRDVALAQVAASIDRDAEWTIQVDQAIDAYLGLLAAEPAMTVTFSSPSLGESIVRAQRDGTEAYARLLQDVAGGEAFRSAGIPDVPLARAYMLVGGLHLTVIRAVERGEDVLALAPEFKAVFKTAISSAAAVSA